VQARFLGWSLSCPEHGDALAPVDDVEMVVGGRAATPELAMRLGAMQGGTELQEIVSSIRKLSA
jgi:hypothetical protein